MFARPDSASDALKAQLERDHERLMQVVGNRAVQAQLADLERGMVAIQAEWDAFVVQQQQAADAKRADCARRYQTLKDQFDRLQRGG